MTPPSKPRRTIPGIAPDKDARITQIARAALLKVVQQRAEAVGAAPGSVRDLAALVLDDHPEPSVVRVRDED